MRLAVVSALDAFAAVAAAAALSVVGECHGPRHGGGRQVGNGVPQNVQVAETVLFSSVLKKGKKKNTFYF